MAEWTVLSIYPPYYNDCVSFLFPFPNSVWYGSLLQAQFSPIFIYLQLLWHYIMLPLSWCYPSHLWGRLRREEWLDHGNVFNFMAVLDAELKNLQSKSNSRLNISHWLSILLSSVPLRLIGYSWNTFLISKDIFIISLSSLSPSFSLSK